jgi:hypothetical protein
MLLGKIFPGNTDELIVLLERRTPNMIIIRDAM